MRPTWRSTRTIASALALTTLAAVLLASTRRSQEEGALLSLGKQVVIRPSPGRRGLPLDLPRGEILLFSFLKGLADHTGEVIRLDGSIPPDQTIKLSQALKTLEVKEAQTLLQEQGFDMSRDPLSQKDLLVQRRLERPTKRGALVRRGEDRAREAPPRGPTLPASSSPSLRLFRRADGTTVSYLVQFETPSSEAAAEVMILIEAALRAGKR